MPERTLKYHCKQPKGAVAELAVSRYSTKSDSGNLDQTRQEDISSSPLLGGAVVEVLVRAVQEAEPVVGLRPLGTPGGGL